jgi:uncharacterized protein YqeY
MISPTINQKIAEAMKAGDSLRLSTLRMLSSALNYERIARQHDLSEDEELQVVKKEAKKRTDAIEALKNAQGKQTSASPETIAQRIIDEEKELSILREYLPDQISDDELEKMVDDVINELGVKDIKGMGAVIGAVKAKAGMRADGSKIAQLVRNKLA